MPRPTPVHRSITAAGMKKIQDPMSPAFRWEQWSRQRRQLVRLLLAGILVFGALLLIRLAVSAHDSRQTDLSAETLA